MKTTNAPDKEPRSNYRPPPGGGSRIRRAFLLIGAVATMGTTLWTLGYSLFAQSVPQPVLSIAPTGTNQVSITITNGVSTANYELQYTLGLQGPPSYPWNILVEGFVGETNFVVDMNGAGTAFFRAASNIDFDGDGVPNYKDADPYDPNVGVLTVIIYTPANGSTISN